MRHGRWRSCCFYRCAPRWLRRRTGEAEYYGTIGKKMTVYRDANEDSAQLGKIEAGTVVDVYKKGRTWTRIGYESGQGYVLTKFVEMVQRKNPFDGPMPAQAGMSR